MTHAENRRLEREFGMAFIESIGLGEFDWEHSDAPDFLIHADRLLGIEITQIYNSLPDGRSRVSIEGSWDRLISNCKKHWDAQGLPACHVRVQFAADFHVSKSMSQEAAENLVHSIRDYVPVLGDYYRSSTEQLLGFNGLISFSIERIVNYNHSLWSFNDSLFVPNLKRESIQQTIDKKEGRRQDYLANCSEIWLVIALYGGRGSGAFELTQDVLGHPYKHHFDRVYIFDCLPKDSYKLANLGAK